MRFQGDSQWQRDFRELARAESAIRRHVRECKQFHDAGELDKARRELALADDAKERAELWAQKLRELT